MSILTAYAVQPLKAVTHVATAAATPGAWSFLGGAALWNTSLDRIFYDIPALAPAELATLTGPLLAQGTILVVHPQGRKSRIEIMCGNDFVAAQRNGTSTITTLVVPGIGGTSIAAAALARNVANALHAPVAAIVPGYGAVDLLADAFGGWFVLGVNNRLLDLADQVEALGYKQSGESTGLQGDATANFVFNTGSDWPSPMALLLNEASEVIILRELFREANKLELLVGHSKGSLSLAFSLNAVERNGSAKLQNGLHVVTIGCVTHFPEAVKKTQFLGSDDALGRRNSRCNVPRILLPGKRHSLNSEYSTSVIVADVLKQALAARA